MPYIALKPIWDMSAEELREAHARLYKRPDTKASKGVPDVTLTFPKGRAILRMKRAHKIVHDWEVKLLADENDKTVEEILEVLTKRKVQVVNERNECLNPQPEKNASGKRKKRKDVGGDQLLIVGSPEHLHAEGPTKADPEAGQ